MGELTRRSAQPAGIEDTLVGKSVAERRASMVAMLVGVAVLVIITSVIVTLVVAATSRRAQHTHSTGRHELEAEDWPEYGNKPP